MDGKEVLFSGTPCQVDGLKGYLGKDYSNLITVDIICHGVPNEKVFQGYIQSLENKLGGKVTNFYFRDKANGWGLNAKIVYQKDGVEKVKLIQSGLSSYYKMFLESKIYRENCYTCPYASENRPADFTIGDYWGIEKEHPNYLTGNGGNINSKQGVSCLIVNTDKGEKLVKELSSKMDLMDSTFEKVKKGNAQLNQPSRRSGNREMLLKAFEDGGYDNLEKAYKKSLGKKYYARLLWGYTPLKVKRLINKLR